eukprot:gene17905-biopygen17366
MRPFRGTCGAAILQSPPFPILFCWASRLRPAEGLFIDTAATRDWSPETLRKGNLLPSTFARRERARGQNRCTNAQTQRTSDLAFRQFPPQKSAYTQRLPWHLASSLKQRFEHLQRVARVRPTVASRRVCTRRRPKAPRPELDADRRAIQQTGPRSS